MTVANASNSRFWDRMAPKYSAQPISDEASYERKLEITRRYLRPTDQVLELGCGTGSTALQHAPYVAHLHATDFSRGMIDIARRKTTDVPNISFSVASVEALEKAPNSVDVILALNLLHLVDDPEEALSKIRSWLKPGGYLVASTACIADIMPAFRLIGPPMRWFGLAPRVQVFSQNWLEDIYHVHGFEILESWLPPRKRSALFSVAKAPMT